MQLGLHIIADGSPQPQELHIVPLDEADGAKVIQLLPGEGEGAQVVDLGIDLLEHFLCENNALVAAAEIILAAQVGVLVEDHLIHVELVQIRIQQGQNNGLELHKCSSSCVIRP